MKTESIGWFKFSLANIQQAEANVQEAPNEHGKNFTVQVTKHWDRSPREAEECPSVEVFENPLETALCCVLWDGPA